MSAPCLVIEVRLEAPLRIYTTEARDDQRVRLEHWITTHEPIAKLVDLAIELERQERAA